MASNDEDTPATPFARIERLARKTGLSGITPSTWYATPALKVAGKGLMRLKDADTAVFRCPEEIKHILIEANPAVFFETPHYHGYPAILVRLSAADDTIIAECIERAWRMQAPPRLVRERDRQGS